LRRPHQAALTLDGDDQAQMTKGQAPCDLIGRFGYLIFLSVNIMVILFT
jgi:hypothetical protein